MIVFPFKKLNPNQSFDIKTCKTDDECIIQVDHVKFLGVTFDANLRRKIISRKVVFDLPIYRCLVCNEQLVNEIIFVSLICYLSLPH